jgi:hypothetical protein
MKSFKQFLEVYEDPFAKASNIDQPENPYEGDQKHAPTFYKWVGCASRKSTILAPGDITSIKTCTAGSLPEARDKMNNNPHYAMKWSNRAVEGGECEVYQFWPVGYLIIVMTAECPFFRYLPTKFGSAWHGQRPPGAISPPKGYFGRFIPEIFKMPEPMLGPWISFVERVKKITEISDPGDVGRGW